MTEITAEMELTGTEIMVSCSSNIKQGCAHHCQCEKNAPYGRVIQNTFRMNVFILYGLNVSLMDHHSNGNLPSPEVQFSKDAQRDSAARVVWLLILKHGRKSKVKILIPWLLCSALCYKESSIPTPGFHENQVLMVFN